MNNKGKASGLALLLVFLVAILVAFLAVKNMGSFDLGNNSAPQQEDYVQQAKDVVNQLNQVQQQTRKEP